MAKNEASSCSQNLHKSCEYADSVASMRRDHESLEEFAERQKLEERLHRIKHIIVVLSGKGGVGKSTVAVNLAMSLKMLGKRVGLLDTDIHGPSIPTMLGIEDKRLSTETEEITPLDVNGMKVISLGFFMPNPDEAIIWRGPMKMSAIKQFLQCVDWGELDYLIIDSPPGTGDEPLSICQMIGNLDGAVVVTTPQKVAAVDVRKSINFCRALRVPVLGVVENMSGFVCPKCGEVTPILRSGGGKRMAEDLQIPFLGSIPMDARLAEAGDDGQAFVQEFADSPATAIFKKIVEHIVAIQ